MSLKDTLITKITVGMVAGAIVMGGATAGLNTLTKKSDVAFALDSKIQAETRRVTKELQTANLADDESVAAAVENYIKDKTPSLQKEAEAKTNSQIKQGAAVMAALGGVAGASTAYQAHTHGKAAARDKKRSLTPER